MIFRNIHQLLYNHTKTFIIIIIYYILKEFIQSTLKNFVIILFIRESYTARIKLCIFFINNPCFIIDKINQHYASNNK